MMLKLAALLLLISSPVSGQTDCSGLAGSSMVFTVTATDATGLLVIPSNQQPGDIGLCAESVGSDRAIQMFYNVGGRRLSAAALSAGDAVGVASLERRRLALPPRCTASSKHWAV